MQFADPALFALALLGLPVLWLSLRKGRAGYAVPSGAAFANVRPSLRLRAARWLPPVLRVAAILLLAVALARPRTGDANAVVPAQGIDIALALDISSSMTTSRLGGEKNRLEATKDVIRSFLKGRENDRIGLVVFQRDALALAPPTLDYAALDKVVADVKSGILPDGTGIGVGLATALNMLRESTAASRIVILLTDGQHNADSIKPEEAAQIAEALKIKVYTIGVVNDARPTVSASDIDEKLLKAIAERTNARYFVADNPEKLQEVYDEIGRLETSGVGRDHYERYTEYAPWFAGAAAGLLAVELLLAATWLRRVPA